MNHSTQVRARPVVTLVLAVSAATAVAGAGAQHPDAIAGWTRYVSAVESRIASEIHDQERFLVLDRADTPRQAHARLRAGELVIDAMDPPPAVAALEIESGQVHHWRGAVFLPGATVDGILRTLRTTPPPPGRDLLDSRILDRSPDRLRLFLKIERRKIVTATYATEHEVEFRPLGPGHAVVFSRSTSIDELQDVGTPRERPRAPGADRGFLWRLNAYWRYQDVPGGVVAEVESVTLSRSVPALVRALVGPIIRSAAHESVEETLRSLAEQFRPASAS